MKTLIPVPRFRPLAVWVALCVAAPLGGAVGCSSGLSPAAGAVTASVADVSVSFTPSGVERIREAIRADIDGDQIAGAVVLLASGGEVQIFESFGSRDREAGTR